MLQVVRYLLRQGADPTNTFTNRQWYVWSHINSSCYTALDAAAGGNYVAVLKLLLSQAQVEGYPGYIERALSAAAWPGHYESACLLAAALDQQPRYYDTDLIHANFTSVLEGTHYHAPVSTVQLLLRHGADPSRGLDCLQWFNCDSRHQLPKRLAIVKAYLGAGAKPGHIHLTRSASHGVDGAVQLLLQHRAKGKYNIALVYAAQGGRQATVHLLLNSSQTRRHRSEWPPSAVALLAAARGGHATLVVVLRTGEATSHASPPPPASAAQMCGLASMVRCMVGRAGAGANSSGLPAKSHLPLTTCHLSSALLAAVQAGDVPFKHPTYGWDTDTQYWMRHPRAYDTAGSPDQYLATAELLIQAGAGVHAAHDAAVQHLGQGNTACCWSSCSGT
jgi:hypothetical protein